MRAQQHTKHNMLYITSMCILACLDNYSFIQFPAAGNPLHYSCLANPEHSVYLGKLTETYAL